MPNKKPFTATVPILSIPSPTLPVGDAVMTEPQAPIGAPVVYGGDALMPQGDYSFTGQSLPVAEPLARTAGHTICAARLRELEIAFAAEQSNRIAIEAAYSDQRDALKNAVAENFAERSHALSLHME